MRNFMKKYQGSGSGEGYSLQRERQKMHFFQMQWEIKTKKMENRNPAGLSYPRTGTGKMVCRESVFHL